MDEEQRPFCVAVERVIQGDGGLHGLPCQVAEGADDALHLVLGNALYLSAVAHPEDQGPTARQVGQGHQVLGQAVLVGGEAALPVQLVELMGNRLQALLQHCCGLGDPVLAAHVMTSA